MENDRHCGEIFLLSGKRKLKRDSMRMEKRRYVHESREDYANGLIKSCVQTNVRVVDVRNKESCFLSGKEKSNQQLEVGL